jgi:hypothetical protein
MTKVSFYSTTPEFEKYYNESSPERQKEIREWFYAALGGKESFNNHLKLFNAKKALEETKKLENEIQVESEIAEHESQPEDISVTEENMIADVDYKDTPEKRAHISPAKIRKIFTTFCERMESGEPLTNGFISDILEANKLRRPQRDEIWHMLLNTKEFWPLLEKVKLENEELNRGKI